MARSALPAHFRYRRKHTDCRLAGFFFAKACNRHRGLGGAADGELPGDAASASRSRETDIGDDPVKVKPAAAIHAVKNEMLLPPEACS